LIASSAQDARKTRDADEAIEELAQRRHNMKLPTGVLVAIAISVVSVQNRAHAEPAARDCKRVVITGNCVCLLPMLEAKLGPKKTRLILDAWLAARQSPARSHKFFLKNVKALGEALFEFAMLKTEIGFTCGTLIFEDDDFLL